MAGSIENMLSPCTMGPNVPLTFGLDASDRTNSCRVRFAGLGPVRLPISMNENGRSCKKNA